VSGAATGALAAVESATGVRPETCPWNAYSDPDVVEVLQAHRLNEKHQFFSAFPDNDPPDWLCRAVDIYEAFLDRVRSGVIRKRREDAEKRAASATPAGWVEEGGGRG
jgi:hypothetical protein